MQAVTACHECDLLQHVPELPVGNTAKCVRCGSVVHQRKRNSIDRTLAFAMAGLVFFFLANAFPFLALKIGAQIRHTTLITGIKELYLQGMQVIAILVFLTTVLVPLTQMLCLLYILVPLKYGRKPGRLPQVFRLLQHLQPWSMMEVFMLGILVSVVKLAKMAKIIPGIAVFSFLALIFILAAMTISLDDHQIWEKWEEHR
jgi:paraquat-inducible protein A